MLFLQTVWCAEFAADRHLKAGVACQNCHGSDLKKPKEPSDKECLKCHEREKIIEKTKGIHPTVNPHNPPHNGECILCHAQHSEPQENCGECHKYSFKVR